MRVERQRLLAGMSQADLAGVLGLSQQAMSRKLRGVVAFELDELDIVAHFFRMEVCDFIRPAERALAAQA